MQFIMITQCVPLMIIALLMSYHSVVAQDNIFIARPGQYTLYVELPCGVNGTEASTRWQINASSLVSLSELSNGTVAGHNVNGRNIVIEDIMMNDVRNGSRYLCMVLADPISMGYSFILYVAGVPAIVPGVRVDNNTININGNSVTLTLRWGEPFNNLDPIVNYTVSCSGDDTCPPIFTTTDNTSRSYTITKLTPMINYTFSVVATNSIGSGEAGIVNITTPPGIVSGVSLTCKPVNMSNLCNVTWDLILHEDVTGYQVRYNEIMIMNVSSSTNSLTFTALPVPDEESIGFVFAAVTAFSRFGVGPTSEAYTTINGSTFNSTVIFVGFQLIDDLEVISDDTYKVDATFNNISVRFTVSSDITNDPDVTSNLTNIVNTMQSPSDLSDVTFVMHNNGTSDQYNVPIICDLFDNNGVYMVEVIALSEERINAVGSSQVINNANIAIVKLVLSCEKSYSFLAGGMTSDGELIGPMLYLGEINATCPKLPPSPTVDESDDELSIGAAVAITFVTTFISAVLVTALITYIVTSLYYKHWYKLKEKSTADDHSTRQKDLHVGDIIMDINPAYATTTTIKMDTNPAYAATSH